MKLVGNTAAAWVCGATLAASASGVVRAQPAPPTRVDAGFSDVGPARSSTKKLQVDLRAPTSFESVYEIRRNNDFASPGQETTPFFMRQNGGVTAVFPRSTYTGSKRGPLIAQIPPNTIFYIGKLPGTFSAPKPARTPAANWLDTSVEAAERDRERAESGTPKPPEPAPADTGRTIFGDEEFRKYRVARLLGRTIGADASGAAGTPPAQPTP